MERDNIIIIIAIMMGIIILLLVITGVVLLLISNNICEVECYESGGIHYETKPNGEYNTDDLCVCYYSDEIKVWINKNGV